MTTEQTFRRARVVDALRGDLTERQCEATGAHALLTTESMPHTHREGPAAIRAEAKRLREWKRDDSGHCRHGVYVGGSGIDWMCGPCEDRDQWTEADELEAYAAELEREEATTNG